MPSGLHEIIAQTGRGREPDRVQNAVDRAKYLLHRPSCRSRVFIDGHIELDDFDGQREFLRGSLRDRQAAASTSENYLRTLLLGELGDTKCQRRIGQHAGDDQILARENTHAFNGSWSEQISLRSMRIGLLGGTGPAGGALGLRLASVGYEVILGSRDANRAQSVCDELKKKWPDYKLNLSGGANHSAAKCDLVVIATPWDSAATVVNEHAQDLAGKIVVTMANALVRVGKEFQPLVTPRGSIAAHVQAEIPLSKVVVAFQHLPATELGRLGHEVDSDVLICSDDPTAIATVCEIVAKIPGCRPLNSGTLSNAMAIEAFTAVLLQLNVRYKTRVAPRLTGIRLPGDAV